MIGRPYGETRKCIVIYNLLNQIGIYANIEMFHCQPTTAAYKSIEDALFELSKRFKRRNTNEELSIEEKKLRKYLETTLKQAKDGTFRFVDDKTARQPLIWWDKKAS